MKVADFGAAVRSYRKASGLSQQDLAATAGLSRATLNYLESGRDIEIGASRLLALVSLLGIPLSLPVDVDRSHDDSVVERTVRAAEGKTKSTRRALDEALATGKVPSGTDNALRSVIDSLGVAERLAVIRCVCSSSGQPPKVVWRNARTVSAAVGSDGWPSRHEAD